MKSGRSSTAGFASPLPSSARSQTVDGRDRRALERLARYITRPPLSKERLERRVDGRYELELKSVWRDGTRALVFEPRELITRLVAAVPPPRMHLLRYFGVLSSHSKLRREVVAEPPADPTRLQPAPAAGDQLALELDDADPVLAPLRPRRRIVEKSANRKT
ncbi:MAG: transposase [Polyangiaceae bacterium]|nr:transposase [Polyangiaceae bacterium]